MRNHRTPHTVLSVDHPPKVLTDRDCRACGGTWQIVKPKDCPRCEGDGRDRFYSVERPKV